MSDDSINIQTFTHKGDVIFTFSQPISRLVMTPEQARDWAKNIVAAVDSIATVKDSPSVRVQ